MQKLEKILHCKEGFRCHSPLSCRNCGDNYQRGHFKAFCDTFKQSNNDIITYFVIKNSSLCTLREGTTNIFLFLDEIKKLKKRKKICEFYSTFEVSFSKNTLGFNPHLNFLFFGKIDADIKQIAEKYNLSVWNRKKDNDKNTVLSLVWYFLKFNKINIEEGEAVRKVLNKRRRIFKSGRFNVAKVDYIDEIIDIDFSFMGTYPIRSKEEVEAREEIREERKKLNKKFKGKIKRIKNNNNWLNYGS